MKHKPWNVFFHELVGLRARVLRHLNPRLVGLEGDIVWETSRTILLRVGSREIKILKHEAVFEIELPGGERVVVPGDSILGDPAERTKRLRKGRRR
ncbi:MAG: ribonuclease P protein subunit [Desulfurococcales archaeon]|nr:ribonuclease P protein subunit [Desulfurococcales archaeon]